jgi:hypothetical protein
VTVLVRAAVFLGAILAFGAMRLVPEHRSDLARRAAGLREDSEVRLNLREQVNQSALVAVLGGLRSLAAALWDLWARDAWEKTNYGEVERNYRLAQRLQPRVFYYWDVGQWMMANNAASFYRYDNPGRRGSSELLYEAYVEKGRAMIDEGQRHLPDEWRLDRALALILEYKYRRRDYAAIAEAWRRAATKPGTMAYTRRAYAYALAHVPGREREAFELLRTLHDEDPGHRKPTLMTLLEIYRAAAEAPDTADPAALHRRLREIYDREFPITQTPLLVRTIRVLEGRLDLPPGQRLPPDAEATAGQPPPPRDLPQP